MAFNMAWFKAQEEKKKAEERAALGITENEMPEAKSEVLESKPEGCRIF